MTFKRLSKNFTLQILFVNNDITKKNKYVRDNGQKDARVFAKRVIAGNRISYEKKKIYGLLAFSYDNLDIYFIFIFIKMTLSHFIILFQLDHFQFLLPSSCLTTLKQPIETH